MAEQSRESLPNSEGLPSESSTNERGTTSTLLTDMFSLLLQEMKSTNSGISALQDTLLLDEDVEEISMSTDEDGQVETEHRDADVESKDTRVNTLVENQTKPN